MSNDDKYRNKARMQGSGALTGAALGSAICPGPCIVIGGVLGIFAGDAAANAIDDD